jgi:hypothetical protein
MQDRPQSVSAFCAMPSSDAGEAQLWAGAAHEPGNGAQRTDRTGRADRRGGRPRILLEMQGRLDAYLDDPSRHLPTLTAANGSDRQQRSERRVACVQLLRAMLSYLDLVSLRFPLFFVFREASLMLPDFADSV